ncbi:ribonuclease HII [Candidatus Pacearchaeota archaeon]|nr:ribonuclease HII [Candidatus Pacearchaeota archaeon]
MLTLGIDDAGRGPLIGPMILAGVLVTKEQEKKLKNNKIRDSKIVQPNERERLAKFIERNCLKFHIEKTFPDEIDSSIQTGTNLNTLEAIKTSRIINEINKGKFRKEKIKVIVDCPSVNIGAWHRGLFKHIENKENLDIICEHKADHNHVSVSAASIIAKTAREEEVSKLKEKYKKYGNIGSGYPADPITQEFLIKNGKALRNSGIFRKTWSTWKKLFPSAEKNQMTLDGF